MEVAAHLSPLLCDGLHVPKVTGQPFHDVTFTAMNCTRSMYVVENGRQKVALLKILCARGNTLRECKGKLVCGESKRTLECIHNVLRLNY